MALSAGTRLGPYEILEPLGAGGMGEVYKAKDTRLDRTVAIKVLPAELAADPQLRARFEREARAISALAHSNICTLYDVGEDDGRTFLVMEHLIGQTLAERLEKGALPLDQALEIASQIAEALSAAHKQGIVHRDLKPSNVMLTKTGARLLDFGLARLTGHGAQSAVESLTSAPTEPEPLTGRGTIMGTLPYMAPEQVEGKPADPRTDLWALGTLVYEMVTGHRAFEAASPVSLIGAILEREPAPLRERQPLTPPSLERLVRRCLAKDPEDRWDSAHDVADELRWVSESALSPTAQETSLRGRGMRSAWIVVGLLGAVVVGAAAVWVLGPVETAQPVVRSLLDVRPAEEMNSGGVGLPGVHLSTLGGSRSALAWTPDGRALVFIGRREGARQLYARELDRDQARPLAGTEGAQVLAVSPDGQWVAFWADNTIRKVPLGGGPVALLVEGPQRPPKGIAWGASGDVFYGAVEGAIWRAAAERTPAVVTKRLEAELSHSLPTLLPGEKVLLYTVRKRRWTWGDEEIVAQVLATGERKVLLRDAVDARYVPSGHLVFLRRGTLFAVAFDAVRLEVRGNPVALVDHVSQALTAGHSENATGAGQYSVAATAAALAYVVGPVLPYPEWTLVSVDRRGQVSPLPAPVRSYAGPTDVSPDGRRLAVPIHSLTEQALWVYDIVRGTLNKLTPEGDVLFPRWAPDGQRVAFDWVSSGHAQLAWQRADGTTPPEMLMPGREAPSSWSPDGRQLALVADDIRVVTVEDSSASVQQITRTPHAEQWPAFSPDGRWLAYGSNVSGRFEVYVQPWPGPGASVQVSLEGGESPAWNPGGHELFFLTPDLNGKRRMMITDVRTSPTLSLGTPRPLFDFSFPELRFACNPARCYSVAPDGQRFFVLRQQPTIAPSPVTHIQLVQNWLEEVKARVPSN